MKKLLLLLFLPLLLGSCHVGRFFFWNFADSKDYKKFASQKIQKPDTPFRFHELVGKPTLALPTKITLKNKAYSFEEALDHEGTLAFLVIRNDSILYEKYFDKYTEESIVPSFSVAKSFTSALVGIAVAEGYIKTYKTLLPNILQIWIKKNLVRLL